MEKEKIDQFFNEFLKLQDKYGIQLLADGEETHDYDWDEEPYISGHRTYISLWDKVSDEIVGRIDWDNAFDNYKDMRGR